MSPEQAVGRQTLDGRSDIYGVGAIAYYLLTGATPFVYPSPVRILAAHLYETARPLTDRCPDVPTDLQAVVLRCLAKDPNSRFRDARTAAEEAIEIGRAVGAGSEVRRVSATLGVALAYDGLQLNVPAAA